MRFTDKRKVLNIMRSNSLLSMLFGFYRRAKNQKRVLATTNLDNSPHQYLNKGKKFILRSCSQPVKMDQPERNKVFIYNIEY